MGIFRRKDSRTPSLYDKDERESVSTHSARNSSASLKSPSFRSGNFPISIPEVPIARPPDPDLDPAAYLRSIHAVRERTRFVSQRAKRNQLNHFDVDMTKFKDAASYVVSIIKVGFLPKDDGSHQR
jgi:hypothetical protein